MYQCTNCDQRYCATCWKQKRRLGAKLADYEARSAPDSRFLLDNIELHDTALFPDLCDFEPSHPLESNPHVPQPAASPLLHLSPSADASSVLIASANNGRASQFPTETLDQGAKVRHGHHRKLTDDAMSQYRTSHHAQSTENLLPVRSRSQRRHSFKELHPFQNTSTSPPSPSSDHAHHDEGQVSFSMERPPAPHMWV